MTADRDAAWDQVAAALAGIPVRVDAAGAIDIQQAEALADALLPVVDRIANERGAAELRAAASELVRLSVGSGYNGWYASWLRARADALGPS